MLSMQLLVKKSELQTLQSCKKKLFFWMAQIPQCTAATTTTRAMVTTTTTTTTMVIEKTAGIPKGPIRSQRATHHVKFVG